MSGDDIPNVCEVCAMPATRAAYVERADVAGLRRAYLCDGHANPLPYSDALGRCTGCGNLADPHATFPGGLCLECWAVSPEGRRMPTGAEVRAMWGV